jgi:methylated-DNA-protein-cysteine methyltransferase-like protein
MGNKLYDQIYRRLKQVPVGHVTTYGAIARQLGCTARTVGFAMAALPKGNNVPWHRVVNYQGRISPRSNGDGSLVQEKLLITEGIALNTDGRIDLERYAWSFMN